MYIGYSVRPQLRNCYSPIASYTMVNNNNNSNNLIANNNNNLIAIEQH
jgi:hypothetical protein